MYVVIYVHSLQHTLLTVLAPHTGAIQSFGKDCSYQSTQLGSVQKFSNMASGWQAQIIPECQCLVCHDPWLYIHDICHAQCTEHLTFSLVAGVHKLLLLIISQDK